MKTKLSLKSAASLTNRIIEVFRPGCLRVEVAGSIRRRKPEVGDIEIVCIPNPKQVGLMGVFDLGSTHLDDILAGLTDEGRLIRLKNGNRYKQFAIPGAMQLDLFLVPPEEWGMGFAIRTGSANFSHKLVTQRAWGGLLPSDWYVKGNRLWQGGERIALGENRFEWRGGVPLPTPEEKDVFELIGLNWLDPADRN